jgi:hypothetical protein
MAKTMDFYAIADPVCRGYTLTRVTHGLDRDLVPLTMVLKAPPGLHRHSPASCDMLQSAEFERVTLANKPIVSLACRCHGERLCLPLCIWGPSASSHVE